MACGHPVTAEAARAVLDAGGNAFDAAAAALCASFVAEPLLSSPGGGGFILAAQVGETPRVYDFFTHTPREKVGGAGPEAGAEPREGAETGWGAGEEAGSNALDFREVEVDFGSARQGFRIGLGSAATPGAVAGLFDFHGALGRMPLREVVAPALARAWQGIEVTPLQAHLAAILAPILRGAPEMEAAFLPGGEPLQAGTRQQLPELADLLETLAIEGRDLFYRGEVAAAVDRASREGGRHLRREDFLHYAVERREPLAFTYRGHAGWTNPPPASGGVLVAFGLACLEGGGRAGGNGGGQAAGGGGRRAGGGAGSYLGAVPSDPLGAEEARRFATALVATGEARRGEGLEAEVDLALARRFLAPETVARYRRAKAGHPPAPRGTSHLSVVDAKGNAASLSISNGEGCGWVVPGCGFVLNNMLGEADLQPRGFGAWKPGVRLTSMMAPTLVRSPDGHRWALGSGGSNRIRSAILQVLVGLLDHGLPVEEAVARPRLHAEGRHLGGGVVGGGRGGACPRLARARGLARPEPLLWRGACGRPGAGGPAGRRRPQAGWGGVGLIALGQLPDRLGQGP